MVNTKCNMFQITTYGRRSYFHSVFTDFHFGYCLSDYLFPPTWHCIFSCHYLRVSFNLTLFIKNFQTERQMDYVTFKSFQANVPLYFNVLSFKFFSNFKLLISNRLNSSQNIYRTPKSIVIQGNIDS